MRGVAGVICALAALVGAGAAVAAERVELGAQAAMTAEPVELDAGALAVRVQPEPFRIDFTDTADGDVLRTLAGAPHEPGDLHGRYGAPGFSIDLRLPILNNSIFGIYRALEVETVWFHATRLVRAERMDGRLRLEAETNDPLGHRLRFEIERTGDGVVAVESRVLGPLAEHVTVSGSAFEAAGGERYLGFGERSNAVDQTGNHVFNWSEEGPFSSGVAEPLLRALLPEFTFPSGPTATNFPIPWLLSTRGFGVLIDQPERSAFNLRNHTARAWQAQAESTRFRFEVYAGPRPADVLRRYSAKAGRQPDPAPWMLGPWVQFRDGWEELFREQDVPASVAQTYTHYLPCGAHVGREQAERERVARHHRLGYRITTYFNPHVCRDYARVHDEAERRGLLVKDPSGRPYLLTNPFTADVFISEIDFSHPEAADFFGGLLEEALDAGYDGWMEDFGEYTPTNAVLADGRPGTEMHNLYPVLYHCASTEQTGERAPAVFIRSGWHGVQPCARAVWGGDPTEDWSCADGLCAAVHQALSMGLSGIAWWGTDIGGFHAVVNPRADAELQARWLQFGAVNGIMRTQANGYGLPIDGLQGERAQVWSPEVLPIFRRWAKLRTQLAPYLAAAGEEYRRDGLPVSRHLALAFPDDPDAVRSQTELLFGRDILAAPVIQPGARTRSFHLPAGQWVDLWRSARWDDGPGTLRLAGATVLDGGRRVTLPAPLEEMPLLVRAGAVIPLLAPDVDTLADVGEAPGLVRAADRAAELRLLAFPRGARRSGIGDGERLVSREGRGRWTLRVEGARKRTYRLEASLATLKRPFRPCSVRLGGRAVPFEWDGSARVLRVGFAARRGTLDVRACGR